MADLKFGARLMMVTQASKEAAGDTCCTFDVGNLHVPGSSLLLGNLRCADGKSRRRSRRAPMWIKGGLGSAWTGS